MKFRKILGLASLALGGCLEMPEPPGADVAPAAVLEVRPSSSVGETAIVAIAVTSPVKLSIDHWPIMLSDSTGQDVPAGVTIGADGWEIRLAPQPAWPQGQRISIAIDDGFVDAMGRPLMIGEGELAFETVPVETIDSLLTVRCPSPARPAPLNLRSLAVALSPLISGAPPAELVLESEDGTSRITARVEEMNADGVLFARLPEHRGPCQPLCPATRYRVGSSATNAAAAPGPRGEVLTATIADVDPPVVTSTAVRRRGDRVIVEVIATEPVWIRGAIRRSGGALEAIAMPAVPAECVFIESPAALEPDADYAFELDVEDIAGNRARSIVVETRTMPSIAVAITEIVPAPAHDWGNSDGLGVPFDDQPGFGTVSSADEWVELVNLSDVPIDLGESALVLRVIDSSPSETTLEGAPGLFFGDGGSRSRWWPGEALVVRPRGSIAQRGFVLEVASGSRLLDRVVVGDVPEAAARSGTPPDLDHESLAKDGTGRFAWCKPTPGNPLPNSACL